MANVEKNTEKSKKTKDFSFNKVNELPSFFYLQTGEKKAPTLGILQNHLINFLKENGFCFLELGASRELVQIIDQIVVPTKVYKIKRFITDFLALQDSYQTTITIEEQNEHGEVETRTKSLTFRKEQLIEKFMIGASTYVGADRLDFLDNLPALDYLKDTKEKAYLLYKNGYVEVSTKGYELLPYSTLKSLKKYVRHDQILNRDFSPATLPTDYEHIFNDPNHAPTESKYNILDFVYRLCGKYIFEEQEFAQRLEAFQTHMGYLAHDFFEYKRKMVIFTDRNITNIENPEGRTGKGILGKFVLNIRKGAEISGKAYKSENKHKYAQCDHTTQFIHIDDMHKGVDYETLFNDTDYITIDPKGRDTYSIRAKMMISTNYLPKGTGDSFRDRWAIFDVIRFFEGDKEGKETSRNPIVFYNEYFFGNKWGQESWQIFDNFMAQSLQTFFQKNSQIIAVQSPEMRLVNLIRQTHVEFVKFVLATETTYYALKNRNGEDTKGIVITQEYPKNELFGQFKEAFPDHDKLKQNTFTKWCKELASYQTWTFNEFRSNGKDYLVFSEVQNSAKV